MDSIDKKVKEYLNSSEYSKKNKLHLRMSNETKNAIYKINLNMNKIEIEMATIKERMHSTCETVEKVEDKMDKLGDKFDRFIQSADNKYADKENFIFWRNLLISGMIFSIFIGIISILIEKLLS